MGSWWTPCSSAVRHISASQAHTSGGLPSKGSGLHGLHNVIREKGMSPRAFRPFCSRGHRVTRAHCAVRLPRNRIFFFSPVGPGSISDVPAATDFSRLSCERFFFFLFLSQVDSLITRRECGSASDGIAQLCSVPLRAASIVRRCGSGQRGDGSSLLELPSEASRGWAPHPRPASACPKPRRWRFSEGIRQPVGGWSRPNGVVREVCFRQCLFGHPERLPLGVYDVVCVSCRV